MTQNDGDEPAPGMAYEIKIDPQDGPVDWEEALKELERTDPADMATPRPVKPPVQKGPVTPRPTPPPVKPLHTPLPVAYGDTPRPVQQFHEEFIQDRGNRVPSLDGSMVEDLEKLMMAVNSAMQQLKKFSQAHPYLIAPNIFRNWEDELKETSIQMNREYRRMREEAASKSDDA
ncbi:MAG: hypothetical protein PWP23_764 [Candidatus Sumerlaeota bacterium]|nr:hypothetical protein [Candidatus Sumerlaeota bacterium]